MFKKETVQHVLSLYIEGMSIFEICNATFLDLDDVNEIIDTYADTLR
jgi:uncharacterized protein (DUF433 family)